MSVFISDADTVFQRHTAVYKILINEPFNTAVFHLSEWWLMVMRAKNKGKVQLGNPISGRGLLRKQFHCKV